MATEQTPKHTVASVTSLELRALRDSDATAAIEAATALRSLSRLEREAVQSLLAAAALREENALRSALGLREVA